MLDTRPSHGVTSVIAHRGASRAERENTVAAFRRAAELGADMVELDVRRSADGGLVVHHDAHLEDGRAVCVRRRRPTCRTTCPRSMPRSMPVPAWRSTSRSRTTPPSPGSTPTARCPTTSPPSSAPGARPTGSSSRRSTGRASSACGPWPIRRSPPRGWSTAPPADVVDVLVAGGHQALHPWWQAVDAPLIERCHAAGLAVNVWTCDEPDAMGRLAAWGVDGICTNVPDVAVAVLRD